MRASCHCLQRALARKTQPVGNLSVALPNCHHLMPDHPQPLPESADADGDHHITWCSTEEEREMLSKRTSDILLGMWQLAPDEGRSRCCPAPSSHNARNQTARCEQISRMFARGYKRQPQSSPSNAQSIILL